MESLTQFAQYIGPTLAAVYLVVSSLATLFAILAHVPGAFGAFCGKVASALGTVALDVNKLIGLVKPMFGKGAVKVAGAMLAVLALLCASCIADAPIVPVTSANSAQISTCQSLASQHNGMVIGDFVLGAAATPALASIAAALPASDSSTKTDLAISAAVVGGVAVAGAGYAAITASSFANSNCSSVVGNLPATPSASAVKP
jgi:hypothetical protein